MFRALGLANTVAETRQGLLHRLQSCDDEMWLLPTLTKVKHRAPRENKTARCAVDSRQLFIEYVLIKVKLYRLHFSCDFF